MLCLLYTSHSLVGQLLGQRQYSSLERCQSRMQTQNGTNIVLAVLVLTYDFLVVSVAQEGQCLSLIHI